MNEHEKRALGHYRSKIKDIKKLEKALSSNNDEIIEKAQEEFDNQILSVEQKIVYDILLSYGGPNDGLKITIDAESKEPESVVYWFAEEGYYQEFDLSDDIKEFLFEYFSYLWER